MAIRFKTVIAIFASYSITIYARTIRLFKDTFSSNIY